MNRLRILLAIAAVTWAALQAYDQGYFDAVARFAAGVELPDWEPAADREVTDRPEDAFQRAWNSSEKRTRAALARDETGGR